eukprot:GFYU01001100.1.p1 GENE.GFYU01001100.1~~GFYU01001100.1.p1  ORF type:complete len:332 (+),score=67.64 GFYU01001100.1:39-1034(+)
MSSTQLSGLSTQEKKAILEDLRARALSHDSNSEKAKQIRARIRHRAMERKGEAEAPIVDWEFIDLPEDDHSWHFAGGLDIDDLIYLALACDASYKDIEGIFNTRDGRKVDTHNLPNGGHYILYTDDETKVQTLAIRGTGKDMRDVIRDLECQRAPCEAIASEEELDFHKGFAAEAIQLIEHVKQNVHKDYNIDITGHSLGGAVAVLIALFLHEQGYHIDRCVTFGQPKITSRKGAEILSRPEWDIGLVRIVDEYDPVVLAPPNIDSTGYTHFGKEIVLKADNTFSIVTKLEDIVEQTSFWNHILHDTPSEHHMSAYIGRLEGIKQRVQSSP